MPVASYTITMVGRIPIEFLSTPVVTVAGKEQRIMTADYLMFWEFGWWNAKTFRQGASKGIRSEECDSVCQLKAGGIIPGFST